ncbi:unnamed protein product [Allacma fusca]|uniref:Uncharacterized protein n=1 Tax=Allacma fusca TaxID=39272 RepID=A0A8J2KM64_9HEXA|nr:unnamed protein product [Allacma fusca]
MFGNEQESTLEDNLEEPEVEDAAEESNCDSDSNTNLTSHTRKTHSQECDICARFKEFVSKTNDVPPEQPMAFTNSENLKETPPSKSSSPFRSRYDYCCFHPEGHLPFTKHTSSMDIPRRSPTLIKSSVTQPFICMTSPSAKIEILPPLLRKQPSGNQLLLQPRKNQKSCEADCQKPQDQSENEVSGLHPFVSCVRLAAEAATTFEGQANTPRVKT